LVAEEILAGHPGKKEIETNTGNEATGTGRTTTKNASRGKP
jgi:hypothetical protein